MEIITDSGKYFKTLFIIKSLFFFYFKNFSFLPHGFLNKTLNNNK